MTEDEAKTKACCGPFAGRTPYGSAKEAEEIRVQGIDPDYVAEVAALWPCIGSACMAWRKFPPSHSSFYIDEIKAHRAAHGSSLIEAKMAVDADRAKAGSNGYCGLAGTPQ